MSPNAHVHYAEMINKRKRRIIWSNDNVVSKGTWAPTPPPSTVGCATDADRGAGILPARHGQIAARGASYQAAETDLRSRCNRA